MAGKDLHDQIGVIPILPDEVRRKAQLAVADICLQGDHPVEDTEMILSMLDLDHRI